jgi:hypothetical protein
MKVLDFVPGVILATISFYFPEQHNIKQYMFLLWTMRQELRRILSGGTASFTWWK